MSSESEVTEFEQERMQHPTGHCEDCGCPLEVCCKPKKPVVEVEWLEKYCKENKLCVLNGNKDFETIFIDKLLEAIKNQVSKK